jgi:hypothetical protein
MKPTDRTPMATAWLTEEFPGIGPAGASIYLREVQEAWPSVAPYVDDRMTEGARRTAHRERPPVAARRRARPTFPDP